MFYGDFLSIPLILVITLHDRKTLFCVFLRFRDLPEHKLTWVFLGVNILPREAPGGEEVNETRPRGQTGIGGTGPQPGRTTQPRLGLEPPLPSIFAPQMLNLT
jgi:hypothetical protein